MSTQIKFDIDGLTRAIESGDARYQLALYADDAEVELLDRVDPAGKPRLLQGKSAIQGWIEDTCQHVTRHRVLNPEVGRDRVALTEECLTDDGSQVCYLYSAEVRGGRISRQTVTRTETPKPHVWSLPPANFLG